MMLQVRNLVKIYGKTDNRTTALDDVSFDVERGEFICIMLALSAIGMGGLAGCKADTGQSKTPESRKPAASSGAYEDSREITSEEKEEEEEKRRTEIASQYSVYETYGMSYDYEKDRFVYNGQVVRNWFLSYNIHTIGRI